MNYLDHIIALFFFFFFNEPPILFSVVTLPIYIPTSSVQGLLHTLSTFVIYRLSDDDHLELSEVIP